MMIRLGLYALIWGSLALTSCDRAPKDDGLTEEALAAEIAEDKRLATEKRERERQRNLQKKMDELREKEAALAKKKEEPKSKNEKSDDKDAVDSSAVAGADVAETIDWKTIEDKMVARRGAIGTDLGTIKTRDGTVYKEVLVKATSSIGITIYHFGGVNDLEYVDLSPQLQAKFLYDPAEVEDALNGKALPRLNGVRMKAVQNRIAKAQNALAQAESQVAQATLVKQDYGMNKATLRMNRAAAQLVLAEKKLAMLEEEAKVARFGPENAKVKLSGTDSAKTNMADDRVRKQALVVAKANKEKEASENALKRSIR
jgi:hypothetical protein